MLRCIDANALQARLERKKAGIANQRYTEGWNDCMMRVKSMVSTAPTIDAAPAIHGRWKYYHKQNKAVCTSCSFERDLDENFGAAISCPNCGANMDGGEE